VCVHQLVNLRLNIFVHCSVCAYVPPTCVLVCVYTVYACVRPCVCIYMCTLIRVRVRVFVCCF
jgi:hypothetical protein